MVPLLQNGGTEMTRLGVQEAALGAVLDTDAICQCILGALSNERKSTRPISISYPGIGTVTKNARCSLPRDYLIQTKQFLGVVIQGH